MEKFILNNNYGIVRHNVRFSDITTMKVGGLINNLYFPNSINSLIIVVKYLLKYRKKYFVIGNGSNIIASDYKYKRLVICGKYIDDEIKINNDEIYVTAFMDLRKVINFLLKEKIGTFVKLSGVPATIGGALFMNASANGYSIYDDLVSVRFIENGVVKEKSKEELKFSYRKSEFQNSKIIILSAIFKCKYNVNALEEHRKTINMRKEKQPLNFPNSGSIFRNGPSYYAYEIIKKINLVDYKIGNATFSKKHSNFIINLGNARAKDIFKLIFLAKKLAIIYEGIKLKEEVILLNFKLDGFLYKKI